MTTLNARPEAITFAPQQSALIVVDMQNAYASQGGYLDLAGFDVSATRPVIENIKTAVAAAPMMARMADTQYEAAAPEMNINEPGTEEIVQTVNGSVQM